MDPVRVSPALGRGSGRTATCVAVLTIASSVLLAACDAGSTDPPSADTPTTPETETASPPPTQAAGDLNDEPGDVSSVDEELPEWEPPVFTREDWLSWSNYDLDELPEVAVIREINLEEQEEVIIACMADQGFSGEYDAQSGGTRWSYPTEQQDAFTLAMYTCDASYPLAPEYYQPYSTEQLVQIYSWQVEQTLPCVEERGYEAGEPPTLTAYVEWYSERMTPMWDPLREVIGQTDDQSFRELEQDCPGLPPADQLYGS